ncbi:hypothetical protein DY78_GL001272 [Lactiplantibacillus fabifermentans DSM 21115]|uniref:SHOCT domain-containing protein n=1 Tax=Lactiplantibacillus fabifermentans DSM 21115 TaxID=1413187 RepID=A0A0R2NU38_9LACO|nr:hypothetical protein DY78_GL001272 [Lactiplantibacillus fabifermentans DSM 21115]
MLKDTKVCVNCGNQVGLAGDYLAAGYMTLSELKGLINNHQTIDAKAYRRQHRAAEKAATDATSDQAIAILQAKKATEKRAQQQQRATDKAAEKTSQDRRDWLKAAAKADHSSKFGKIYLDFKSARIFIDPLLSTDYRLYDFSDLDHYKIYQEPTTIKKGHALTDSILGGMVAGPAGAMYGAMAGEQRYSAVAKLGVVLYFNDGSTQIIMFIKSTTETDSSTYQNACATVDRLCKQLDQILQAPTQHTLSAKPTDTQMQKLIQLRDAGIITSAEFEAKKRQILEF